MANAIAETRVIPLQVAGNLFGVRIEQKLVMVEAKSLGWFVGAIDAIAVDEAGTGLGQIAMPNLVGLLADTNAM